MPSSPNGPCRIGSTTSTSPRVAGTPPAVGTGRVSATEPALSPRAELPAAVAADLDGDGVVARGIERGEHRPAGRDRDLVLARAPAEEDGDADARRSRRWRLARRRSSRRSPAAPSSSAGRILPDHEAVEHEPSGSVDRPRATTLTLKPEDSSCRDGVRLRLVRDVRDGLVDRALRHAERDRRPCGCRVPGGRLLVDHGARRLGRVDVAAGDLEAGALERRGGGLVRLAADVRNGERLRRRARR